MKSRTEVRWISTKFPARRYEAMGYPRLSVVLSGSLSVCEMVPHTCAGSQDSHLSLCTLVSGNAKYP